ncbi:hypothetical protein CDAR_240621 [Caerostris darwini]|uniref:Uncharacterized protein n=1 Tax=Caerostris darwini TaxID=1538125 RepID=A0AAV4PN15_9ARAC|nr:hypothetical protein CDAR_240621 [Caerostris darwini]
MFSSAATSHARERLKGADDLLNIHASRRYNCEGGRGGVGEEEGRQKRREGEQNKETLKPALSRGKTLRAAFLCRENIPFPWKNFSILTPCILAEEKIGNFVGASHRLSRKIFTLKTESWKRRRTYQPTLFSLFL